MIEARVQGTLVATLVATDRRYSADGVWAKAEGNRVQISVSDFLQQRSGGDEVAIIETIKVNISLPSPVNGSVIEVNPAMGTTPEPASMG